MIRMQNILDVCIICRCIYDSLHVSLQWSPSRQLGKSIFVISILLLCVVQKFFLTIKVPITSLPGNVESLYRKFRQSKINSRHPVPVINIGTKKFHSCFLQQTKQEARKIQKYKIQCVQRLRILTLCANISAKFLDVILMPHSQSLIYNDTVNF